MTISSQYVDFKLNSVIKWLEEECPPLFIKMFSSVNHKNLGTYAYFLGACYDLLTTNLMKLELYDSSITWMKLELYGSSKNAQ